MNEDDLGLITYATYEIYSSASQ